MRLSVDNKWKLEAAWNRIVMEHKRPKGVVEFPVVRLWHPWKWVVIVIQQVVMPGIPVVLDGTFDNVVA